jgi:hypothetical protein
MIHYGTDLKVVQANCHSIKNNFFYYQDGYLVIDTLRLDQNNFIPRNKYFLFLTWYKQQWWIFDYICIN